jgi:hypothetical protein
MAMWSDAFFTFGWLIMMGWGWFDVYLVAMEVAVREKATTQLEIHLFFKTEQMAKVMKSHRFGVKSLLMRIDLLYERIRCHHRDLGVESGLLMHVWRFVQQDRQYQNDSVLLHGWICICMLHYPDCICFT